MCAIYFNDPFTILHCVAIVYTAQKIEEDCTEQSMFQDGSEKFDGTVYL